MHGTGESGARGPVPVIVARPVPVRGRPAWPQGLPVPLTGMVGRQRELAEVVKLAGACRLITLTGAGGVGKTRLAIEVGATVSGFFPDGVQLVDLSAVEDAAVLAGAVATALGVEERAGADLEDRLAKVLRPQRRLVILDNCEHLRGPCSSLVARILAACPGVVILATSRESLAVPGEVTWRVPSLTFPGPGQRPAPGELERYEAAALFLARARANRPGMVIDNDGAAAVTAICCQLDGIPLALELAAARAGALGLGEIAERITGRLELLERSSGPARHQTLLASIEWSYQLLGSGERVLFRRLAIFAGGWSLASAEAVCAGEEVGAAEVARVLATLVDKSLVQVEWSATEARYRLLAAIRVFALDRLVESGELATVRSRHGEYFAALGESSAPRLLGPDQARRASQLDNERENLRAARAWCAEDPARAGLGLRLASGLWEYFHIRGMLEEGAEWLQDALRRACGRTGDRPESGGNPPGGGVAGDVLARAAALNGLGVIVSISGDYHRGGDCFAQSIALYEQAGDRCGLSRAWTHLGNTRAIGGDRPGSAEAFGRGLAIAKESGSSWHEAFAIYLAGFAATVWGDTAAARPAMAESTQMFARLGDRRAVGYAQMVLGGCLVADGRWAEALPRLREAMQIFNALPERWGLMTCTGILAWATAESGDWERTAILLGVTEALSERISGRLFPHMQATADALVARTGQQLGPQAQARFEAGRAIGRTDRIAAGLWPGPAAGQAAPAVADLPLTRREREVASLIAEGLTNRQIGERLFIAERTVDTHVTHILARLGCASRSQVAAIVGARTLAE